MARFYEELDDRLIDFIRRQQVFFVATVGATTGRSAEGGEDGGAKRGWINLSPKGLPFLAVLDRKTIAYADYPGSGRATAEHLAADNRITVMFCSFSGDPMVLRIYGQGKVAPLDSEEGRIYLRALGREPLPWVRRVIIVHVEGVQTSCGYGVPLFEYRGDRSDLPDWCRRKEAEGSLGRYML